ncbi:Exc2 family lipoprotein [Salmonella enterica]
MSCCCQPSVDSFSDNVLVTITLPDKPMALTILPNLHHVLRLYPFLKSLQGITTFAGRKYVNNDIPSPEKLRLLADTISAVYMDGYEGIK